MTTIGKFTLYTFAEFQAWVTNTSFNRVIKVIQNHHTYIPGYAHFKGNNHFELLKSMERGHIERGFAEIAQNLTTYPDGTIAVCRSFDKIPAGIKGANSIGLCIEHIGNFNTDGDTMSQPHRDSIINLNAVLCKKFNLTPSTDSVVYHHWYDLNTGERKNGAGVTKTCPGTNFFGGNKVEDAQKNFIPLVANALNQFNFSGHTIVVNDTLQNGTVNARVLNVRSLPATTGAILKTLREGTTVAIYESKNGWYRIDTGSQWVKAEFINI
ncbi:MAG: hypothetical protein K0S32_1585 [Bacteroidetes bacterium]|jgi:hypothetical protein|nr:hypothetical protein [Bacteroidota bacterium]